MQFENRFENKNDSLEICSGMNVYVVWHAKNIIIAHFVLHTTSNDLLLRVKSERIRSAQSKLRYSLLYAVSCFPSTSKNIEK